MRSHMVLSLILIGLAVSPALSSSAAFAAGRADPFADDPQQQGGDDGPDGLPGTILQYPGMPPLPRGQDDGAQIPGLGDQGTRAGGLKPSQSPQEKAQAARAEALKRAMMPQKTHAQIRAEMLDSLFKNLSKAQDSDEADGIAAAIERVWLQSDSPTANLLMQRGVAALGGEHLPLALELFDRVLDLDPNWAEAWAKRATTRLLGGDVDGAIADMRQVVKLEPRQFAALAALGMALHRQGFDKEALSVMRKSLALDPQQPQLKDLVDKLSVEVEGRDI